MQEDHKRQSGALGTENAVKIGTNIILHWVKAASPSSPTLSFHQ